MLRAFLWDVLTIPLTIARELFDLFGPDDFDRAIAEQAAELQRLADNDI